MRLTGERLASALEALHEMNCEAGGYARLAGIIIECSAQNGETRKRGAKLFAEVVEDLIVNNQIAVLASAVRDLDNIRKKRERGEITGDDNTVENALQLGANLPIRHQNQKELAVICCIEDALRNTGTLPTAQEVLDRLGELISRSHVYGVFERVSERTGLEWDDQRDGWVWPDKSTGD